MLTVAVNDRPLDVAAIVERGRILLPMRATFTALGATVTYDPDGTIVAHNAAHTLRLRIGSPAAQVDGRPVELEVAPRVVAARAYVPLRFVAQSMGAVVGYDARANLVNVALPNASNVAALNPTPGSTVGTAYPTISASLGTAHASPADVTLTVDGEDVTQLASFDGATITYMPRIGLERGTHSVVFSGKTIAGENFSASWNFRTSLQAPPDAPALDSYGYRFYASGPGIYYPGDWMHFVLIAPPGGSAEMNLCDVGYQYALWNNGAGPVYEANVPAPSGLWLPSCAVTAVYTSWNGRQYIVPIPVVVGFYTSPHPRPRHPTPSPKPSARPIPHPGGPRRIEPTPMPTVHQTPAPTHAAAPAPPPPTAAPTARPRPIVPRPRPRPVPRETP